MLMHVGTYVDLTHLNGKKKEAPVLEKPREERLVEVGTKIFFVDYLKNVDTIKLAENLFVKRLSTSL